MATVAVDLVTPEKLFASTEASLVEVPGEAGDFGVLPGHAPMISTIRPGVVTLHGDGKAARERYLVVGGMAEVTPERCTILAEYMEVVTDISAADANKRLDAARKAANDAITDEEKRTAERELRAAEALSLALSAA